MGLYLSEASLNDGLESDGTQELAAMMTCGAASRHVAVVVLNYNSERDLMVSAPQLAAQTHVKNTLILVDNASRADSVDQLKSWLLAWRPDAVIGMQAEVDRWIENNPVAAGEPGRIYFITHHENRGYSAGNNIGIRLADMLGADAVLIANPDMRIEDPSYVATLAQNLFSDERHYVAASRIVGLDGRDQNPLREPLFWEEILWPLYIARRWFKWNTYVQQVDETRAIAVPKVSGCCLLLRMTFLRSTGCLDENVFLYCEEPILSARVRTAGGVVLYVPALTAVHAHVASEKGDSALRMPKFITSRKYYLRVYGGYKGWRLKALEMSYDLLALAHQIRGRCKK